VRTLPNTPAAIGAGITPWCARAPLAPADRAIVDRLLGALGQLVELGEEHMDAVTALSGSGPAFLFEFVAALRDGGVAAGLPRETAQKLALETVLGAAKLLVHTGGEPEALRDKVVSPNGTTLPDCGSWRPGSSAKRCATRLSRDQARGELSKD